MLFKDITLIDDNYNVQEHMCLAVNGKQVAYIGKDAPPNYHGEVYEGRSKVLMPGFFNMHSHVPMGLLRGYGEGLPLDRWLHERVFPFEDLLTPEDMYWGTMLGLSEMMASGVVSFTDMYMNMPSLCRAIDKAGMKANLSHGSSTFLEGAHFEETDGWKGLQFLIEYVNSALDDRIIGEASLHAEYTSTGQLLREVGAFAKEHKLRVHFHLSETQKEHKECKARRGMTPAKWFARHGVLDVPAVAAHCVWLEDGDFELLAEKDVTIAHCPTSNLKLGSGIANVKKMLDSGIRVCIGTDGAASNNNLNMLEEINLASILHKGVLGDPLFMGPKAVLELACRNGAIAQGRLDCGSIKVGNRADLVVFDLDKPHCQPVFDTLATVLYSAQASDVCLTMIDGNVVYKNGEFKTIDIEQAKYNAQRIRDEKLAQLSR